MGVVEDMTELKVAALGVGLNRTGMKGIGGGEHGSLRIEVLSSPKVFGDLKAALLLLQSITASPSRFALSAFKDLGTLQSLRAACGLRSSVLEVRMSEYWKSTVSLICSRYHGESNLFILAQILVQTLQDLCARHQA